MSAKHIPSYEGNLRAHRIDIPACISQCSGIRVFGRRLKSLVFTTDVAILRNVNADAVIAVYPFTPQPSITRAILSCADMPVFVGVGGGVTRGGRVVGLAIDAERAGAFGVVVNAPTENKIISMLKEVLEVPVVVTVVSERTDVAARLAAGADILNVSGAAKTPQIVAGIRKQFPKIPIIATGGPTEETIQATIAAGANAITYTPPTNGQLFSQTMEKYRRAAEES